MMRAGILPGNTHTALFPLSEAERGNGPNKEGGGKTEGREGERWKDGSHRETERGKKVGCGVADRGEQQRSTQKKIRALTRVADGDRSADQAAGKEKNAAQTLAP